MEIRKLSIRKCCSDFGLYIFFIKDYVFVVSVFIFFIKIFYYFIKCVVSFLLVLYIRESDHIFEGFRDGLVKSFFGVVVIAVVISPRGPVVITSFVATLI